MINSDSARMNRYMTHLNKQILMLDSDNDILMLGCAMAVVAKNIFDAQLGKEGRETLFNELASRQ